MYNLWQSVHFGNDAAKPEIAGEWADPDRDGLANLMEYGLGLNPNQANVPSPFLAEIRNGELVMSYSRPSPPPQDLEYRNETSDNLQIWFPASSITVSPPVAGRETVHVRIPISQSNASFLRLKLQRR